MTAINTHEHPYTPGSYILKMTAIADDFDLDLEVNQVIELSDEQDLVPSPMQIN